MKMSWMQVSLKSSELSTVDRFLAAVTIWRQKPHVVNRRLCGSELLWTEKLLVCSLTSYDIAARIVLAVASRLPTDLQCMVEFIQAQIQEYGHILSDPQSHATVLDGCEELDVTLRLLIPKQSVRFKKVLELIITDTRNAKVFFIPIGVFQPESEDTLSVTNDVFYILGYSSEKRSLSLDVWSENNQNSSGITGGVDWLSDVLLTKLARWSQEPELNTDVLSLRLVSVQQYGSVYERLKDKYGRYLVQIWPENTDPLKFVYEDIGIAAYLLVLWQEERQEKGLTRKQSFIDLGCGNGLLVYILSSEGHNGLGVDVRRRKIWDILSDKANLKEQTIIPSDSTLFPEYDWLIGNHSDELTPWIPLMAARSHYDCRYFVLPCCAWDFTTKFADNISGTSHYRAYLNYVRQVGETCGFQVGEDVLRIPSTKRVCFVGMKRTYAVEDGPVIERQREELLHNRCQAVKQVVVLDEHRNVTGNCWTTGFNPRPAVEKQKNAVTVDRSVKELIATRVLSQVLMSAVNVVEVANVRTWNRGGSVSLNEVGLMFGKEILSQLKSECGGIQTVLKNCADVFQVREGSVYIRDWTSPEYLSYRKSRSKKLRNFESSTQRWKTSVCFYYKHHPDGCPLVAKLCRFAHGTEDLQSNKLT